MGGGAPDPEGKASAKRKRIDALDRRLAGGKGASSAARASASRPGDSSRGRDGDRPSSVFRRDARGPRAGGRGARDGTPASRPRPEDDRSRLEPSSDRGAFAAQTDAPWYAPSRRGARSPRARAGSIPVELTDSGTHAATAAGCRQARTAYVERTLVELAETSARTGADVDAVVRGKTRDRALLLDAAAAGGGGARAGRGAPQKNARNRPREWRGTPRARGFASAARAARFLRSPSPTPTRAARIVRRTSRVWILCGAHSRRFSRVWLNRPRPRRRRRRTTPRALE